LIDLAFTGIILHRHGIGVSKRKKIALRQGIGQKILPISFDAILNNALSLLYQGPLWKSSNLLQEAR
jgi:hypothetical protein